AVLPGVALTLTQSNTGLTRTAVSGRDGRFVLAVLPAGTYELRAELSGFRTTVQTVQVTVGETLSITLVMAVGGVAEEVSVSGGRPPIHTATAELSYLVDQKSIEMLPLNGRNYTDL